MPRSAYTGCEAEDVGFKVQALAHGALRLGFRLQLGSPEMWVLPFGSVSGQTIATLPGLT